jgi:hypothetical protein
MTPNTSPKKPAWFALTENSAASAQVRKVDKKLPAATAIVALAIVAFGTFFASGSMNFDSSPTSNLAGTSMSTVTSGQVNQSEVAQTTTAAAATAAVTQIPVQNAQAVKSLKVVAPQSMNGIADPTLNGGGDDDNDDDDEDEDEDEDDDDDDDRD